MSVTWIALSGDVIRGHARTSTYSTGISIQSCSNVCHTEITLRPWQGGVEVSVYTVLYVLSR